LQHLEKAKEKYDQAVDHKVNNPFLHGNRYGIAFLENDASGMQQQIAAVAKPGEDVLLSFASDTEAFHGRLAASRELSKRAVSFALHDDSPETAAAWQMDVALRDAEFNNVALARQETAAALSTVSTRDVSILAALTLARIGDTAKAKRIADDLAARFPLNTVINRYWLPTIYASIEIDRGNPARAVELLQTTRDYELGSPLPQFEVGGSLYPVYVRGQAYLLLHQGREAAEEFQKYLGETRTHVQVLEEICKTMKIDPKQETPGRKVVRTIGQALVDAMKTAKAGGDPAAAEIVACESVVIAETKDHLDWEHHSQNQH